MSRDQERISSDRIDPTKLPEGEKTVVPDRSKFQGFMEKSPTAKEQGSQEGISPIELPKGAGFQTAGPSIESLLGQVNTTEANFNNLKNQLNTPDLKFKRQHQYLLRNKLTDANDHIRGASNRLNADMIDPSKLSQKAGPVEKFLAYVTDGQNQLLAAKARLEQLKSQGQVSPSDMLLVQVKLSQAQQELEYSSILLSSVISVLKQMMNIQL